MFRQRTDNELLDELTSALKRAVGEAKEAELIDDHVDHSDWDVASVSNHPQNRQGSGFYPIVRVMADLWERLAVKDPTIARKVADRWFESDQRLLRRLALHAARNAIYPADIAARMLLEVNDRDLYCSGAHREIMKLTAERWNEFPEDRRQELEQRLLEGPPATLFSEEAHTSGKAKEHQDRQRFLRLARIEGVGGVLSPAAEITLQELRTMYPAWQAGAGDRDDFLSWSDSYHGGPRGDLSLLADVSDEDLINRAFQLQKKHAFEHGEIWRVLCRRDPDRALRALKAYAKQGDERAEAWHGFLVKTQRKDPDCLAKRTAKLLLWEQGDLLNALGASVTQWLTDAWSALIENGFAFGLWDRLADAVVAKEKTKEHRHSFKDILNEAINRPPGHLARILLERLAASSPMAGQGLPDDLRRRFERLATAAGDAGLLARVVFAAELSFLHAVDPKWAATHLLPRFSWSDPEAAALWSARRYDGIGSAALFDALKEPFLALFARDDIEEEIKKQRLVIAALSERRGGPPVGLQPAEARQALRRAGAAARAAAAMFLSDFLKDSPAERRPDVWQKVVGPTLDEIWPLDADLREPESAARLATLALRAGDAFPEALKTVLPFLLPDAKVSGPVLFLLTENGTPSTTGTVLIDRFPHDVMELLRATVEDKSSAQKRIKLRSILDRFREVDIRIANSSSYRSLERRFQ